MGSRGRWRPPGGGFSTAAGSTGGRTESFESLHTSVSQLRDMARPLIVGVVSEGRPGGRNGARPRARDAAPNMGLDS